MSAPAISKNDQKKGSSSKSAGTNQVQVLPAREEGEDDTSENAMLDLLFSSDYVTVMKFGRFVSVTRVASHSMPRWTCRVFQAEVFLTVARITIMGGDLFKRVATVAKLKKKILKKPDRFQGPMIIGPSL